MRVVEATGLLSAERFDGLTPIGRGDLFIWEHLGMLGQPSYQLDYMSLCRLG